MKPYYDGSNPDTLIENGGNNECVKSALQLLGRVGLIHNQREAQWRAIQSLFECEFELSNSTGTRKISSKLLLQALMKWVTKLKFLDFELFSTNADKLKNAIMTEAVSTVMDEGGLARCLRDKGGVFYKMPIFGDSWIQLGTIEGKGFPVQYRVGSLSDTYIDNGCVDVRDPVSGLSTNEACTIYRYNWGQFCNLYPDFKNKVVKGTIPRSLRWRKQIEKTWIQTFYNDEDVIEVAHYWNLGKKAYCMFAGGACTPLVEYYDEEYPYMIEGEAYIPLIHFKCFPSTEGFYNWGLGHALFDLAEVMASMDNMAYNHALDNVYPINFISIPKGQATKVFAKIQQANEQRKAGGKGYAVLEYGAGDAPGRSGIGIEPFQSQPITQEWERAFTRIERQITRLGIQLDAVDRGTTITATQVLSEEENSDQNLKQIMEFNASECKFLVEVTLNMMKNLVSKRDKTPVHFTTNFKVDGQAIDLSQFTLGHIAEELKKDKYFVRINSRSGTIPSKTMQRAEIAQIFPLLQPGSPAQIKSIVKLAQINNQEISEEDLAPQQVPQPQGAPAGEEASLEAPPTETDALKAQKGFKTQTNPIMAI